MVCRCRDDRCVRVWLLSDFEILCCKALLHSLLTIHCKIIPVIVTVHPDCIRELANAVDILLELQDWFEMLKCVIGKEISYFFFFFFQAEDGIRDLTVTGVQTCALPI